MLKSLFILAIFVVINQMVRAQDPGDDKNSVSASAGNGTCVCQVSSPSDVMCSEFGADVYDYMATVLARIDALIIDLKVYDAMSILIKKEVVSLSAKTLELSTLLAQITGDRDTIISGDEFFYIETEITILEERLLVLTTNQTFSQNLFDTIKIEVTEISTYLESLEQVDSTVLRELEAKVKELTIKLDECEKSLVVTEAPSGPCEGALEGVGDAVSHRVMGYTAGVWMADSVKDNNMIYEMRVESSSLYGRYLYEYSGLENFENNVLFAKRDLYPAFSKYYFQSTGHVVYNGSLYAQRYNNRIIYRISTENWGSTGTLTVPSAGYNNQYPYQIGYGSDIDLATDEEGLWVIYATSENSGNIVVSKIDEDSFIIKQTFYTDYLKNGAGNCIMICGVLLCTDDPNSASASFAYFYDTKAFQGGNINIPFDNKFGQVTSLDYNPRDQKLYAWDNGVTTSYSVRFA